MIQAHTGVALASERRLPELFRGACAESGAHGPFTLPGPAPGGALSDRGRLAALFARSTGTLPIARETVDGIDADRSEGLREDSQGNQGPDPKHSQDDREEK